MTSKTVDMNKFHGYRSVVLGHKLVEVDDMGLARCNAVCRFHNTEGGHTGCSVSGFEHTERLMCGANNTYYIDDTPEAVEKYTAFLVRLRLDLANTDTDVSYRTATVYKLLEHSDQLIEKLASIYPQLTKENP